MKMHTKLLGSAALSALLVTGFAGCGSDDDTVVAAPAAAEVITPYTRVAVIPGGWADVNDIALKISDYVIYTDESNITANGVLDLPTNWVIAGANLGGGETDDDLLDLLPIPVGAEKSRVIEFCNKAYALQAVGTGRFHGSALPCEVSVHSDGTNVYVDMLDAGAIFNIFFTDATDNFDAAQNAAFAEMAAAVKSELRQMIKAGLEDDGGVTITAAVGYTESTEELGPQFTLEKIDNDIAFRNPYIIYKYTGTGSASDGSFVKGTDDKALAEVIIDVLGTDAATADKSQGLSGLSSLSAWRSGRPEPIAIPNVQVVEACSPKYARKATALGSEYITALPCEFTVYVDETDDTNNTIAISFLNPNFMFGTMFEGAVSEAYMNGDLNKTEVIEYSTLADVVFGDLRMIVDSAVQDNGAVASHGFNLKITE